MTTGRKRTPRRRIHRSASLDALESSSGPDSRTEMPDTEDAEALKTELEMTRPEDPDSEPTLESASNSQPSEEHGGATLSHQAGSPAIEDAAQPSLPKTSPADAIAASIAQDGAPLDTAGSGSSAGRSGDGLGAAGNASAQAEKVLPEGAGSEGSGRETQGSPPGSSLGQAPGLAEPTLVGDTPGNEPSADLTASLLARWKTPDWARSETSAPTPGNITTSPDGRPSLAREPDPIPSLLRLPRDPHFSPGETTLAGDDSPSSTEATASESSEATDQASEAVDTVRGDEEWVPDVRPERMAFQDRSSDVAFSNLLQQPGEIERFTPSGRHFPSPPVEAPPAPLFQFTFREKSATAPTPEEAAQQNELVGMGAPVASSGRAARIGSRSELPRGSASRQPHRALDITPEPTAFHSQPEGDFETRERNNLPDDTSGGPTVADEEAPSGAETGALDEIRDDRKGRRRKDRRFRRRDRNGGAEETDGDEGAELEAEAETGATPVAVRLQDEEQLAEQETLSRISIDQRLGKEILVNTGARETRIAYLVSGMLMELHIEREERLVGAICKARVERILPGMGAAFVDCGLDRNAFLMAGDVSPDEDEDDGGSSGRRSYRNLSISDLVKPRQEIMVQITKAPHGTKGARVSTRVSLPGRFLVLMPDSETTGVSRKIDDDAERDRLKKVGRAIRPQGFGLIVRTEAENKTEEELRADVDFLLRLWRQVQEKYRASRPGSIVHRDLSLTFKVIRDLFGSDVNRFVIDNRDEYEKVMELVDTITPRMKSRVIMYDDPTPLFERVGIEEEIERLFRNKVWLKSGGTLLIDETEALTTIDVNTGKYVGTTNPQQTIFKINMEAVGEICRQLRLRDIGGMIILDFIDMSNPKDRSAVMKALEVNLKRDRARTKIAHLSPLGLVEMTRKRTGETFRELNTEPCNYCGGRGRTLNPDTVSIQVERELKKQAVESDDEAFLVMVHPSVAPFLVGAEGENADRLERELRRGVFVRSTDNLHIEKFEVAPSDMQEVERQLLPYREGQVLDCIVEQSNAISLPHAVARLDGYMLDLVNGGQYLGRRVRARIIRVGRSIALAEVVGGGRPVDKLGGA